MLMCPPKTLGYSLHLKVWCQFMVDKVEKIERNVMRKQEDFFETKLELNEDNKKLLKVVEIAEYCISRLMRTSGVYKQPPKRQRASTSHRYHWGKRSGPGHTSSWYLHPLFHTLSPKSDQYYGSPGSRKDFDGWNGCYCYWETPSPNLGCRDWHRARQSREELSREFCRCGTLGGSPINVCIFPTRIYVATNSLRSAWNGKGIEDERYANMVRKRLEMKPTSS